MTDTITTLRAELDTARKELNTLKNPPPQRRGPKHSKFVRQYRIGENVRFNNTRYIVLANRETGDMILSDMNDNQTPIESINTSVERDPKTITGDAFMSFSSRARQLFAAYIQTIHDEENPHTGMEKGFTARELGLRRTKAHNALMEQLRREGVDCSDRAAITEMARRYDEWIRE